MTKHEKSIRYIGTYFLVLGFICSFLAPLYFSYIGLLCPICIVLLSSPRLLANNCNKWSNGLLMTCAILTSLTLLFFDGLLTLLLRAFDQIDLSSVIIIAIITAIVLLNFYLCYHLFYLLFKTKQSE